MVYSLLVVVYCGLLMGPELYAIMFALQQFYYSFVYSTIAC